MEDKNISEQNMFFWRYDYLTQSLLLCIYYIKIQHNLKSHHHK